MNNIDENTIATLSDVVNAYDDLDVSTKRKELGIEISELTIVVKQLLNDISEKGAIFNTNSLEEYENLYNGLISEGEYLTGLYEDVLIIKELLGVYFNKVVDAIYTKGNE